ncbi:MAG: hypothetical protein LBB83_07950 [Treponema sp.]|nr:hypothetical protein [Treponema sp.]
MKCSKLNKPMVELIILESLAFFFLLLPLIRPIIKNLWSMDGLVWLPVLALGIIIALFPAYGFRPECIPLLLYTVVLNIINIPQVLSLIGRMQNDDFRERNPGLTAFLIGFLILVTGIGIYFLPGEETALAGEGVSSLVVYDEERNNKYFLRVYGQTGSKSGETVPAPDGTQPPPVTVLRPALFVVPPITGSILMVDRLCAALRDGGFTVISYSRLDFDFPAVDQDGKLWKPPLTKMLDLFRSYTSGRSFEIANNIGRSLETERREDIRFLLNLIRQNQGIPGYAEPPGSKTDWERVFAAGYGAGGSALLSLTDKDMAFRGIVVIESQFLSVYRGNDPLPAPEPPQDANWFRSLWAGISAWAADAGSHKITGIGAVPNPEAPLCFIVSDHVQNAKHQNGRYAALIRVFRTTTAPVILASVSGAGVLDYSDTPEKYPIYSFLLSGQGRKAWSRAACVPGTAALITNFAASVLERENTGGGGPSLSRKPLAGESLHLESRGAISL